MREHLPREILNAPKAGFGAPLDLWLARDLQDLTDDLLSTERVRRRGYFRPDVVQRMLREHREGSKDWSFPIWQLLTFETWAQVFLDRGYLPYAPACDHELVPTVCAMEASA